MYSSDIRNVSFSGTGDYLAILPEDTTTPNTVTTNNNNNQIIIVSFIKQSQNH